MVRISGRHLLLALSVALFMSACGKPAPQNNATAPEAAVKVTTGPEARIPEDFPKDVPLPEGITIENVSAMPAQGTFVVQGKAQQQLESLASSMQKQIEAQGWSAVSSAGSQEIPDMKVLNFTKAGKMLNLTLIREDNATSINLTVSPQ